LTYDGAYASFTATSLDGFAVTTTILVPEPSAIALLLASAACLIAFAWRRKVEH
jgi:hypothetical protein